MDSGVLKEPRNSWGLGPRPSEAAILGRGISVKYRKYTCVPMLFARWDQRCGLSLSVLQQLAIQEY